MRSVHIFDRTNNRRDLGVVVENGGDLVVSAKKSRLHDGNLTEKWIFEKLNEDSVEVSKTVGFKETRSALTPLSENVAIRPAPTNAWATYREADIIRHIDSFENLRGQF